MKTEQEKPTGLPENAFRPLKPGEKYEPNMSLSCRLRRIILK